MTYIAIHSEGGLLPLDVLDRVGREELRGQKAADFGLPKGTRLTDEIAVAWSDAIDQWDIFKRHQAHVSAEETGTTVTRERWMLPLLTQSLGYADLTFQAAGAEVEGKLYPISHRAGKGEEGPPVDIEGFRVDLDRRPPTGHRRLSPHALVQEYLNREEGHLWGIVTNGLRLRLLRDTSLTSRPTYLEFDLESILEGNRYNEFALFYRLCHRTRLPGDGEDPTKCFVEAYYQEAIEQGGRVRDKLRDGVEEALKIFGTGFLQHPADAELREKLQSGKLPVEQYHQQLLRLVYRLLFLMVAEERHMIVPDVAASFSPAHADVAAGFSPAHAALKGGATQDADRLQHIYDQHYSVTRLRERAEHVFEKSPYSDLWLGLKRTFRLFSDGVNSNPLDIPPLNGDLFGPHAMRDLEETHLYNDALIQAIRHLSLFEDNRVRRRVNYAALDVEEMGSVYESLLDFHPAVEDSDEGPIFVFRTGTERKSTGSYYTRPELVRELIESALVPVMEERLAVVEAGFSPAPAVSAHAALKGAATEDKRAAKEHAILSMTVCDPACGSGHFLLAAARRLGKELAKIRTGEEEPTPKEFHLAVRDVISHCIYGVDMNPLAVDLCKLSLWLEGHWTGKPLSFLDHHIKCGNSLIGVFDPDVLKQGIPDEAFNPVAGDDRKAASAIKKRNKKERTAKQRAFGFGATVLDKLEGYAEQLHQLSEITEDNPGDVKRKADLYRKVYESPESHRTHRLANLWTAAFFMPLTNPDDPTVPTHERFMDFLERGVAYGPMIGQADTLALKRRFFHWFLEFPEVFARGGFDVVLGNPPWERIKLQEEEFFATRDTEIANAPNKATRQKLIEQLPETQPKLAQQFQDAKHAAEAESKHCRQSRRFPLTGIGDINTYALFAEVNRQLINAQGRIGVLLPTGIATNDTSKAFFSDLTATQCLISLVGFENEAFIFPDIHHTFKFCALTLGGPRACAEAHYVFLCRSIEETRDKKRHFKLSDRDLLLLNPNTRTCPIFRSSADAGLTLKLYSRAPVLVDEVKGENPWNATYSQGLFHSSTDAAAFGNNTTQALINRGGTMDRSGIRVRAELYIPYYEGKMVFIYDHRYGTFVGATQAQLNVGSLPQPSPDRKRDPNFAVLPRYWVMKAEVEQRLAGWPHQWLIGFRDFTSSVVERTAVFAVLPRVGLSDQFGALFPSPTNLCDVALLVGNLNSLVLDYVARQKVGWTHLKKYMLWQFPVLPPDSFSPADRDFLLPRVLELTYVSWDLKVFGEDMGYKGEPFRWDEDRRARIRAELDAYYAHLYGLTRDELRYILDPKDVYGPDFPGETFRVLKEKEEKLYGEYRTRRMVLEAFDKLAESPRFRDEMPKRTSALQIPGKAG